MAICRKNDYCKFGIVVGDETEGKDDSDYESKRCFRCMATSYDLFEPVDDEEE
ncbi:hypothetical protein HN682_00865 [Candidatus Peregrinibacteria bacterium]|jgi:hypothetical protein|nr:hypothetical protein [Candidatus Woesearchaeota archaeon]MBT4698159.1 hypothetical protein [Candidatus Woesearchaeota archaeon]MBT4716360.1 hypothetical protein [Candidatus Woesearchaeota archaeon]MBT7928455.1 hypothetical protein [Candidatus Peregrinibacteria bacterium]MBT7930298.1 hypothetical protein [Candidatus Woesearchaeota archaeon]